MKYILFISTVLLVLAGCSSEQTTPQLTIRDVIPSNSISLDDPVQVSGALEVAKAKCKSEGGELIVIDTRSPGVTYGAVRYTCIPGNK
jgi:uncharacterized protein YcfL